MSRTGVRGQPPPPCMLIITHTQNTVAVFSYLPPSLKVSRGYLGGEIDMSWC